MKTQHTPGPWQVDPTGDIGDWFVGTTKEPIATCAGECRKANARLIAAAPELLEALEALGSDIFADDAWDKARAAIAKATATD